jgi:hypothetical protein
MEYSEPILAIDKLASRLYSAIKCAAEIDQGTGSTLTALAYLGFIQVPDPLQPDPHHSGRSQALAVLDRNENLQNTTNGHLAPMALASAGESQRRGEQGLPDTGGGYGLIRWSWQHLEDYSARPWRHGEVSQDLAASKALERQRVSRHIRVGIRDCDHRRAGRALYEEQWQRFHDLYPDVEAPIPVHAEIPDMTAPPLRWG